MIVLVMGKPKVQTMLLVSLAQKKPTTILHLACDKTIQLTRLSPISIRRVRAELKKKLAAIELENKSIREEFNVQRAKLKDIFLQKEGERCVFGSPTFGGSSSSGNVRN